MERMPKFLLRGLQDDDIGAVNDLYFRLTGRRRTAAQYNWEWRRGPCGPGLAWVIVETATEKIAGHYGMIPIPMRMGGEAVVAARTENTMLNPDFSGQFPYHAFEAKALRECKERFPMIVTTSGMGAHGAVRQRLGYRSLGRWRGFTVNRAIPYYLCRAFGAKAATLAGSLVGMISRPAPAGWTLEKIADGEPAAELWRDCRHLYGLGPDRTAAYINWRFRDHGYRPCDLILARVDGEPFGFVAVLEERRADGIVEREVQDIFVADRSAQSYLNLLRTLAHAWQAEPCRIMVRTLLVDPSPLLQAITTLAPKSETRRPPEEGKHLLYYSGQSLAEQDIDVTSMLVQGI
jgi:hypothetical protein